MMTQLGYCKETLSKLLSLDLRKNVISSWTLRNLRDIRLLDESIRSGMGDRRKLVGSRIEGTEISGSDMDFLNEVNGILAVCDHDSLDRIQHTDTDHFQIKSCGSPGFCWMEFTGNSIKSKHVYLRECLVPIENKTYLSSEKFNSFYASIIEHLDIFNYKGVNGPAVSSMISSLSVDFVYGIKCVLWPRQAEEWITRSREYDWPEPTLVQSYNLYPCYVIPSGKQSSEHSSLMWRYAFVGMERELIWSFNDTQIQTLLLLKMINKSYLKPIQTDQITSFALKQIIFWDSERNGLSFWTHSKLLDCVDRCLRTLQKCIQECSLSHYIIRERNILDNKLSDVKLRQQFIEKIDDICSDIAFYIFNCGIQPKYHTPGIVFSGILTEPRFFGLNDWNLSLDKYKQLLSLCKWEWTRLYNINEWIGHLGTSLPEIKPLFVPYIMKQLQEIDNNNEYVKPAKDITRVRYSTIVGYVCLASPELPNDWAKQCFLNCCKDFTVSNKLHLANYHYVCGEKQECFDITKDFCSTWGTLQYTGQRSIIDWSRNRKFEVNQDINRELLREDDPNYEKYTIDLHFHVFCDMRGLPEALQFMWTNIHLQDVLARIAIHPLVYAYYLLFQLYHDVHNELEANIILKRLHTKVSCLPYEPGQFTESFILGFCLFKKREYNQAGKWFIKSIMEEKRIKWNVAYYFLCISFLHSRGF